MPYFFTDKNLLTCNFDRNLILENVHNLILKVIASDNGIINPLLYEILHEIKID